VTLRVPPDDRTYSYVEFWLPAGVDPATGGGLELQIAPPPNAPQSDPIVAQVVGGNSEVHELIDDADFSDLKCRVTYQPVGATATDPGRGRYVVCLSPTAFHGGHVALAPSGNWTITVRNTGADAITLDGWVHWDGAPISYTKEGQQSFFTDDAYRKYDPNTGDVLEVDQRGSSVNRFDTINAIATGVHPVVVGGYQKKCWKAARYSSADAVGATGQPDLMAMCEAGPAHLGILASGTRSGSTVAMNGTSVAAPQVARQIAFWLAGGDDDAAVATKLTQKAQAGEAALEAAALVGAKVSDVAAERRGEGRGQFDRLRWTEDKRVSS